MGANWRSLGAAAIVVSLIFVGLQVRDANTATYADTYDQLLADLIRWRTAMATSPETLQGLDAYVDPNNVAIQNPTVLRAGVLALEAYIQIYERAYFARSYGRLNDSEWNRFQRIMCNPVNQEALARANLIDGLYSQEFWHYLSECSRE